MISAIGLVVLMMQNRYGRLKDRTLQYIHFRNLLMKEETVSDDKTEAIRKLINFYFKETRLVKNAMLFSFISIGFVIITCITILIQEIGSFDLSLLLLGFFTLALLLVLISIAFMSISLAVSISTVKYELEQASILPILNKTTLV